jgi:hypothetical protein
MEAAHLLPLGLVQEVSSAWVGADLQCEVAAGAHTY